MDNWYLAPIQSRSTATVNTMEVLILAKLGSRKKLVLKSRQHCGLIIHEYGDGNAIYSRGDLELKLFSFATRRCNPASVGD